MQPGEVDIKSEGDVQVYHLGGKSVLLHSCTVSLTNYRVIFIDGSSGVALDLGTVLRVEDLTSVFRHSSRIRLHHISNEKLELKFIQGTNFLTSKTAFPSASLDYMRRG